MIMRTRMTVEKRRPKPMRKATMMAMLQSRWRLMANTVMEPQSTAWSLGLAPSAVNQRMASLFQLRISPWRDDSPPSCCCGGEYSPTWLQILKLIQLKQHSLADFTMNSKQAIQFGIF